MLNSNISEKKKKKTFYTEFWVFFYKLLKNLRTFEQKLVKFSRKILLLAICFCSHQKQNSENPNTTVLKIHTSYQNSPSDLIYYLPTPPLGQDMTRGQFLSGV